MSRGSLPTNSCNAHLIHQVEAGDEAATFFTSSIAGNVPLEFGSLVPLVTAAAAAARGGGGGGGGGDGRAGARGSGRGSRVRVVFSWDTGWCGVNVNVYGEKARDAICGALPWVLAQFAILGVPAVVKFHPLAAYDS